MGVIQKGYSVIALAISRGLWSEFRDMHNLSVKSVTNAHNILSPIDRCRQDIRNPKKTSCLCARKRNSGEAFIFSNGDVMMIASERKGWRKECEWLLIHPERERAEKVLQNGNVEALSPYGEISLWCI